MVWYIYSDSSASVWQTSLQTLLDLPCHHMTALTVCRCPPPFVQAIGALDGAIDAPVDVPALGRVLCDGIFPDAIYAMQAHDIRQQGVMLKSAKGLVDVLCFKDRPGGAADPTFNPDELQVGGHWRPGDGSWWPACCSTAHAPRCISLCQQMSCRPTPPRLT